jgi:hypothetical protein
MKKIDKIVKEMIEHANNAGTEVEESNPLEKIPGFMGTDLKKVGKRLGSYPFLPYI